jgi:biopolymer transport protein ExbB
MAAECSVEGSKDMLTSLRQGRGALLAAVCFGACFTLAALAPVWGFQNDPQFEAGFPGDPGADPNAVPAPAPAAPEAASAAMSGPEPLVAWMLRTSGLFGYLILLVGFVLAMLVFHEAVQLRRENFLPAAFVTDFERLLNDKNYQAAYEAARANDSFLGKVLAAGMARVPRGYDEALAAMQEAGDSDTMAREQSIGYLWLIGTMAPMLGLLGTVQGMLMSFRALGMTANAARMTELADGISMALVATLEGLVVAIPAILFHTLFKNRLANFVRECGVEADELMCRFQHTAQRSVNVSPRTAAGSVPVTAAVPAAPQD